MSKGASSVINIKNYVIHANAKILSTVAKNAGPKIKDFTLGVAQTQI